jgi:isocitrate lyase
MTETPKPDLSDYEEEAVPFEDVMRRLLEAKTQSKKVDTSNQKATPRHLNVRKGND